MARSLRARLGARLGAKDRGAEAVEFALVVPFIVLMLFGVVDFGYMINRDTVVNNASREGAREGSYNPTLNAVSCKVRESLATIETPTVGGACTPSGTPKATLTITCKKPDTTACTGTFPTDAASGGTVIVKVDYIHTWITPVGGTVSSNITLSKSTEMRIE